MFNFFGKSTGDDSIKGLVEYIARLLVDNPKDVSVTKIEDGKSTVFELRVSDSDRGKVIGKKGQTAKAIRTLLGAASARDGKLAVLKIVD